ncbi:MAG: hypothetical protein H6831_04035 [Planctomycetes bacterium]|nr:hypothetical protein [Planctomycetota bacterium]MCB9903557.1 hypothetical protein [Planctomycetota bacterium]
MEWLLIVAFAACIITPLVVQATGLGGEDVIASRERRVPAPPPKLPRNLESWAKFPRATEDWYAERFGLRNQLLTAQHWMKLELFDETPVERVVIGRDDWLFTNSSDALDCNRGTRPFTAEQLRDWRESLKARRDWLASKGIDYALVLVPGKAAVYTEQVPRQYERRGPSRREQFLEELRQEDDLLVVDLLPALQAERDDDTADDHVYYPLGMHWTARGALVANAAIVQALPPRHQGRPPATREDMEKRYSTGGDDFSHQFLVSGRFQQGEYYFVPAGQIPSHVAGGSNGEPDFDLPTWISSETGLTRALVVRDSFGNMIMPFLAQQFSRLNEVTSLNFSPALVEELHPDVVIELFVDHTLGYHLPQQQRVFDREALREAFEASQEVLLAPVGEGDAPELVGLRGTQVGKTKRGTRIATDGSGSVTLPPFTWTADQDVVLALDISAPAPTFLSLYYPLEGVNAYREKQATDVPIHPGRQTIYVALPPPVAPGPIALLPGRTGGDYMIHDVEARVVTP